MIDTWKHMLYLSINYTKTDTNVENVMQNDTKN